MKKILQITTALVFIGSASTTFAQLTPVISGEEMVCPQSINTWTCVEPYETYQWYQRLYGTTDTVAIPGATLQTLTMDAYNVSASYLIVEVTENGETAMSPEFFVDGWAFSGITMMSEGNFEIGNNGEAIICEGDTLFLSLNMPYNTNITWFNNWDTIPGENASTLNVTEEGSYTVSGAPAVCPDFILTQGVAVEVIVENCSPAGLDENALLPARIYPNPSTEQITISHPTQRIEKIEIRNTAGQLVRITTVNQLSTTIATDNLRAGTYFITVNYSDRNEVLPVTIQ